MVKKSGFAYKQHQQYAAELNAMTARLGEMVSEIGMAYPLPMAALAKDARRNLSDLRRELELKAVKENPHINSLEITALFRPQ